MAYPFKDEAKCVDIVRTKDVEGIVLEQNSEHLTAKEQARFQGLIWPGTAIKSFGGLPRLTENNECGNIVFKRWQIVQAQTNALEAAQKGRLVPA